MSPDENSPQPTPPETTLNPVSADPKTQVMPENIGTGTNYATPNQITPLAGTASIEQGRAWPWWKIAAAISPIVII